MVDYISKPPQLCKNNPIRHCRRNFGFWDGFMFFNPVFLKSLDYHNPKGHLKKYPYKKTQPNTMINIIFHHLTKYCHWLGESVLVEYILSTSSLCVVTIKGPRPDTFDQQNKQTNAGARIFFNLYQWEIYNRLKLQNIYSKIHRHF